MKFYAHHGVALQETRVGNTFIIDLLLTVDVEKAVWSDNLEDTVNYAAIYECIKKEMAQPSKLIEAVAGRILKALKYDFPAIQHVVLKLAKLNPPFGGDIHSAAVILED